MSSSAIPVFDQTAQTTHLWLNEIGEEIGLDDQQSWRVTAAVLRAIRDRLPVERAAHLGSQLPLLVRGAYYDQFRPSAMPRRVRSRDEFLLLIAEELKFGRPIDTKDAARGVQCSLPAFDCGPDRQGPGSFAGGGEGDLEHGTRQAGQERYVALDRPKPSSRRPR